MTEPLPAAAFAIPIRVYYEDTDAGGIVYYANWLRYFERARTDWLRALGFGHRALADEHGVLLVVRDVSVDYRRPARLDDELVVDVRPIAVRRASCLLWQSARLAGGDEALVVAQLRFAAIRRADGQATAFPKPLQQRIRDALPAAASTPPNRDADA
ncbi:MAG: YbgC/FadM family acyl-CoA thioesterase [Burkholderiaceae bacterium]|nr:YbgC/FadM family acyl-CoA thioesterase [Burkholderiaceae bacterium]